MEMMVVLLITAIVAAATAPMVNRKLMENQAENATPWVYSGELSNDIVYNLKGGNQTANIGDIIDNSITNKPSLYIGTKGTRPYITLKNTDNSNNSNNIPLHITSNPASGLAFSPKESVEQGATAFGYSLATALGSTAFGSGASSSEEFSVAMGYSVSASGQSSIAIGGPISTGYSLTLPTEASGKNSIAIGASTTASNDNSVAIGPGAKTTAANQIVLGTVNDTVYIPGTLVVGGHSYLGTNDGSRFFVKTLQTKASGARDPDNAIMEELVRLYRDRNEERQQVSTMELPSLDAYNRFHSWSDRRLKNVGKPFVGGLEEVKKLETYNYTFKDDTRKTPRVGVMAQDLEKIFPNAVTKGEDGFLRIRMEDIFYSLVNAVKELDAKFDLLAQKQKKIDELEDKVSKLEKRLADLEKKIK